jgi:hypothetical protein
MSLALATTRTLNGMATSKYRSFMLGDWFSKFHGPPFVCGMIQKQLFAERLRHSKDVLILQLLNRRAATGFLEGRSQFDCSHFLP